MFIMSVLSKELEVIFIGIKEIRMFLIWKRLLVLSENIYFVMRLNLFILNYFYFLFLKWNIDIWKVILIT